MVEKGNEGQKICPSFSLLCVLKLIDLNLYADSACMLREVRSEHLTISRRTSVRWAVERLQQLELLGMERMQRLELLGMERMQHLSSQLKQDMSLSVSILLCFEGDCFFVLNLYAEPICMDQM